QLVCANDPRRDTHGRDRVVLRPRRLSRLAAPQHHCELVGRSGVLHMTGHRIRFMQKAVLLSAVVAVFVTALGFAQRAMPAADDACSAAPVHFDHYPGQGFARLPWVKASPASQGLVGLLWFWPAAWRDQHITTAQVYAGGQSPDGVNMKI